MKNLKIFVGEYWSAFLESWHFAELSIAILGSLLVLFAFLGDLTIVGIANQWIALIARIVLAIVGVASVCYAVIVYVIKRALDEVGKIIANAIARMCIPPFARF